VDLLTALKILVRQWPVVLIGLALTAVGVIQVGGLVKPTYEAKATGLLLGPGTGNRFLAFDANLEVTADALIVVMQSDSGIERVTAAGAEGGYELVRTNGPLIEITGSAPSGEQATATVGHVLAVLEEQLQAAQEGAADTERITLDVLTQPVAAPEYGSRVRAQAAVGAIGLALTVTAGLLTDAMRRNRRERRAEAADGAADDESQPTGDEPDDQASAPVGPRRPDTRGDPRGEPAVTPAPSGDRWSEGVGVAAPGWDLRARRSASAPTADGRATTSWGAGDARSWSMPSAPRAAGVAARPPMLERPSGNGRASHDRRANGRPNGREPGERPDQR
jgi:hypothetical protein